MKWRHQYDSKRDEAEGMAASLVCLDESLTQQQFREDADLNVLVRRFGVQDGSLKPAVADPRFYGDVSEVPDLRTALETVRLASDRFSMLPAELRARFHNRPGLLYDFVNNPKNHAEAVELGLLAKPKAPEPPKAAPPPSTPAPGVPGAPAAA